MDFSFYDYFCKDRQTIKVGSVYFVTKVGWQIFIFVVYVVFFIYLGSDSMFYGLIFFWYFHIKF